MVGGQSRFVLAIKCRVCSACRLLGLSTTSHKESKILVLSLFLPPAIQHNMFKSNPLFLTSVVGRLVGPFSRGIIFESPTPSCYSKWGDDRKINCNSRKKMQANYRHSVTGMVRRSAGARKVPRIPYSISVPSRSKTAQRTQPSTQHPA